MIETRVHIDFETRSAADLKKVGGYVYAMHETTDALCMAYAIDDGPVKLWKFGEQFPLVLKDMINFNPHAVFVAHNANFEFLIWNFCCAKKYNWPKLPIKRFDCTMVRAYAMGLPGTLEKASKAMGLKAEKDMAGHRIMMQLCKPRNVDEHGKITWWDVKDSTSSIDIKAKYEKLYSYCKTDIIVERLLDKRLLQLPPREKDLWFLDQKINMRGIEIDDRAVHKAINLVEKQQKKFNKKIKEITDGEVPTYNANLKFRHWIQAKGVNCDGVAKADVLEMLENDSIPDEVRSALLIRQEAGKSSTSKLDAMIRSKNKDNRARGCLQYYGAASTGRWAGRRIQLQNLKRPTIPQKEIDIITQKLSTASEKEVEDYMITFHDSVINPISNIMRAMLQAKMGHELFGIDFSSIEGRVLAWLAGEEKTLNVFRSHGKIYEFTATQIYGGKIEDVTTNQRLIGKVATLALGYQGGVGAFQSMAKVYFVKVPNKEAEAIKQYWRAANPNIVNYWYELERAALQATVNEGMKFSCGADGREVAFMKKGSFLFCRLPSGRAICYPYPAIKQVKTPWGEMKNALTYKGVVYGKWVERTAYGGLIAENVTQALARDLLADALFRFDENGFNIVLHVHDEILLEEPKGKYLLRDVEALMIELPKWAKDLPVQAEGWVGERYRK